MGLKPSDEEISAILSEIDVTYNGQMEIQDYLQVDDLRRSNLHGAWAPMVVLEAAMGSMFIVLKIVLFPCLGI